MTEGAPRCRRASSSSIAAAQISPRAARGASPKAPDDDPFFFLPPSPREGPTLRRARASLAPLGCAHRPRVSSSSPWRSRRASREARASRTRSPPRPRPPRTSSRAALPGAFSQTPRPRSRTPATRRRRARARRAAAGVPRDAAFRGAPGTCCGIVAGTPFCCPTSRSSYGSATCLRADDVFRCQPAGTPPRAAARRQPVVRALLPARSDRVPRDAWGCYAIFKRPSAPPPTQYCGPVSPSRRADTTSTAARGPPWGPDATTTRRIRRLEPRRSSVRRSRRGRSRTHRRRTRRRRRNTTVGPRRRCDDERLTTRFDERQSSFTNSPSSPQAARGFSAA